MIIDQAALAGHSAYLVDFDADPKEVNLALPDRVGRTPEVYRGKVLEVSGIDLHIEGKDLPRLLRRSPRPLLTVEVTKEMFPSLYKDPYQHRVHTVGGYEDLERGTLQGLRCLKVDGLATLVSTGEGASFWRSATYRLPEAVHLDSAAWDLATSKRTPDDGFQYSLKLRVWGPGQDVEDPDAGEVISLIASGKPSDRRLRDGLGTAARKVMAYQLELGARVNHDAYLLERHQGPRDAESLGRPLLRSVSLLERVEPTHSYHSLHELLAGAEDYHLYQEPTGPPRRLDLRLGVSASLAEGESISLRIGEHHQGVFDYLSARLEGRVFLRPPVADRRI
ncbi:MAG: hypothetical protein SX243_17700 [Acidobacteriota bacterium]|nr:hypothetical protein [Acidobacteriota bacterium]